MKSVKELLSKMTLREKFAQLTQLDGSFFVKYGTAELTGPLHDMSIGQDDVAACGSVLGAIGADMTAEIQRRHLEVDPNKIPLLFMLDVLHGFRTIFPINLAMSCSFEPELVEKAMRVSAIEASASGIHLCFSPMSDLVRDARWGRIMESYGEDTYLNCLFSRAVVRGFQGEKLTDSDTVAACVKHIAGYGAVESGRDYNTTEIGLNSLFEFYMPAYKAAVDEGTAMAMSAFNVLNGVPCTANDWLLKDVLREKWGFKGPVISDWGAVGELINHGVCQNGREAAISAFKAGIDIEMMTSDYLQYGEELVKKGKIKIEDVDDAVLRILNLKNEMGLFDDPYRSASSENEKKLLRCEEHRELSYRAALKSIVLLENDGILPLDKNKNIAIIGPYADNNDMLGGWGCTGDINETVGIKKAFGDNFKYAKGCGITEFSESELETAIEIVCDSDVVIMALGESSDMSGEAASKTDISLPECQIKLFDEIVKLGKPIVTVVFNGRPILLKDISERSNAVVEAWFPGSEGGNAVRDIVFGDEFPEGRLTVSFPYCNGQMPIYYNQFLTGRPMTEDNKSERYLSKYIDAPNDPLYPFGYGLGYSTVDYSDLKIKADGFNVYSSIKVKNTGYNDITETVQLYVRDICASVARPIKQLKAYKKIFLKSQEEKSVEFILTKEDLSFYKQDGELHFENGDFKIMIGSNSRDVISETVYVGDIL